MEGIKGFRAGCQNTTHLPPLGLVLKSPEGYSDLVLLKAGLAPRSARSPIGIGSRASAHGVCIERTELSSLKEPLESRVSWRILGAPPRRSGAGLPFDGCSRSIEDWVVGFGCHGHVCRGCSRCSFRCAAAPPSIPRESARLAAVVQAPGGPGTEDSAATVSPTPGRLNQRNARQARPSPLTISDWPWRARAFFQGRRPMQPSRLLGSHCLAFLSFLFFVRAEDLPRRVYRARARAHRRRPHDTSPPPRRRPLFPSLPPTSGSGSRQSRT